MKISTAHAKKLGIALKGTPKSKVRPKVTYAGDKAFDALCEAHGIPKPVSEYEWGPESPSLSKTGKPRKWRFDHLFEGWLAVEQVGGVWKGGHHSGGKNQLDDMERRNEAQILGYVVLEFPPEAFEKGWAFDVIRRALASSGERP